MTTFTQNKVSKIKMAIQDHIFTLSIIAMLFWMGSTANLLSELAS
jgi:hypothetical protein